MSGGVTGSGSPQPPEPRPGSREVPHCYRHPDRETYISCQRCGRPICPECMNQAAVGFHCPTCVAEGRASQAKARTAYGGALRSTDNIVTLVLIGLNVAMYLLIQVTGGRGSRLLLETVMFPAGVADGQWWRLLTSTFVHVDLLHLFFNMFALWIFGPGLERLLGRGRFLALYLLSGLAGSVAVHWLSSPGTPTLGASGAVFGLLGAALVVSVRRGYDASWLLALLGINLVFTFLAPNISWQGHLGGLVGGLALGATLAWAPRRLRTVVHVAVFGAVFVLCVLLIVVRTAVLGGA
ncbi:MAG TPA: rhomboid family intramembrane serine protease [Nocardioidaceae bacterium]|nr:rhomboid family intramembrane serine protease [Nocardioidaceae bacterium]